MCFSKAFGCDVSRRSGLDENSSIARDRASERHERNVRDRGYQNLLMELALFLALAQSLEVSRLVLMLVVASSNMGPTRRFCNWLLTVLVEHRQPLR